MIKKILTTKQKKKADNVKTKTHGLIDILSHAVSMFLPCPSTRGLHSKKSLSTILSSCSSSSPPTPQPLPSSPHIPPLYILFQPLLHPHIFRFEANLTVHRFNLVHPKLQIPCWVIVNKPSCSNTSFSTTHIDKYFPLVAPNVQENKKSKKVDWDFKSVTV